MLKNLKQILYFNLNNLNICNKLRLTSSSFYRAHSSQAQERYSNSSSDFENEWKNALSYEKIPGPTTFEMIKNFMPGGKYYETSLDVIITKLRDEYGPISKLRGILGRKSTVFLSDPNDYEKIFRTEGIWPVRNGIDSFVYFRQHERPELFPEYGGLATEHGERWGSLRTKVNPAMLKPKNVLMYIPPTDETTNDFCDRIREIRNKNNLVPEDFYNEIGKWILESIGYIALDTSLGILKNIETSGDGQKLITNVHAFFENLYGLEIEPSLWKYISTPLFKKQMKTLNNITDLCMMYIERAIKNIESRDKSKSANAEESVLEKVLKINKNAAITIALDMLVAGVDTTASNASSFIYEIARNPDKQEILRKEIFNIFPDRNMPILPEQLKNMPYLRACGKEVMRVHPITFGNFRSAGQDIVIKGYQLPKGSDLSMPVKHLYEDDKIFPDSKKFLPERWLRDPGSSKCPSARSAHPFIYLPFGFGPRSCIGKRFAEMEVEILIIRLLRNFKIEWPHKELKYKSKLLIVPSDPLQFKFIDL